MTDSQKRITPVLNRPLSQIARDIRETWTDKQGKPNVHYAAEPYLAAMATLSSMTDWYYEDPARDVVNYFLSNTGTWRGDEAKALKNELRAALGLPPRK